MPIEDCRKLINKKIFKYKTSLPVNTEKYEKGKSVFTIEIVTRGKSNPELGTCYGK